MAAPAPAGDEDLTPRQAIIAALRPLLPEEWRFYADERSIAPETKGIVVRARCNAFRRHPAGRGRLAFQVEFETTITVGGEDIERAEDALDDGMLTFLRTLDDSGIPWDAEWTKALYDGRLGYQGSIYTDALRKDAE